MAAKIGLQYTGAFTFIFLRYVILVLLLSVFILATDRSRSVSWSCIRQCMIIGLLAHALYLSTLWVAFSMGATPGTAALIGGIQPLLTGLFAARALGERIDSRHWLGLALGFGAILLITFNGMTLGGSAIAYALLLIGVACITMATIHQRWLDISDNEEPVPLCVNLTIQCTISAVVMIIPASLLEQFSIEWNPAFIGTLLWLAIGASLGGYGAYWLLLQRCPATQVASLTYITVPVTMLLAYWTFGDVLTRVDIVGLLIASVAVYLTHHQRGPNTNKSQA